MPSQADEGQGPSGPIRFMDVALEGSSSSGLAMVEGLIVLFDRQGIATIGPDPDTVRTIPWGQMSGASCGEPGTFPDGSPATTIVACAGQHRMRWFIPEAQLPPDGARALDEWLAQVVGPLPTTMGDEDPWGLAAPGPVATPAAAVVAAAAAAEAAVAPADPAPGSPPRHAAAESVAVATGTPRHAVAESAPEPGTETEPGTEPEAGTETEAGTEPGAGTEPEAGTEAEAAARPEGEGTEGATPAPNGSPGLNRRPLFFAIGIVVVIGAVVGVVIASSSGGSKSPSAAPPTTSAPAPSTTSTTEVSAAQQKTATDGEIASGDLPAGWTADASGSQPALSAASFRQVLGSCIGLAAAQDPLGHPPTATVSSASPDFVRAPSPSFVGIASGTTVYPTDAPVAAVTTELATPNFETCLGRAEAAGAAPSGIVVSRLNLDQVPGVSLVGFSVLVPPMGSTPAANDHYVVITGGRTVSQLMATSVGSPFPTLVTAATSMDVARRLAADVPTA